MVEPAMWRPTSEDQLRRVIDADGLEETHFLEVKEQLASTSAARKELARDLAQFCIDGGVLLIGVSEVKDGSRPGWVLAPQLLQGLSERIDQIARSTVDPPLGINITQFPASSGEGVGYLVVEIPASASAPHMVDGKYYGRGDKTRYSLSDAEVDRLHATRRAVLDDAERLLDEEIAREPFFAGTKWHGHLFLIAQPHRGAPDLGHSVIDDRSVYQLLQSSGEPFVHPSLRGWVPTPSSAGSYSRRADGVAYSTPELRGTRQVANDDERVEGRSVDMELRDDGGLRVFVGRLTDDHHGDKVIVDGLAIAYATRLMEWARLVATRTNYYGRWLFGLAGTDLAGARSVAEMGFFTERPVYSASTYRQVTTAEYFELDQQPGDVVQRLVGRLLRGLGTDEFYTSQIAHPTTVRAGVLNDG